VSEFIGDTRDKHGFTVRPAITDEECILKCLYNSIYIYMCGMDKKQIIRLIQERGGKVV